MWIFNAILVHLLLLGSIFVIYFRSPVLTGLNPQQSLSAIGFQPAAKRLVLIVTDGLRAESFFRNKCEDIPHLRKLILEKGGLVGVSHTRVPTESRPGHIAMIAGLYEDPSAVMRGWKENPINFDTLFNRSRRTYAFGANDVLHIFSRLDDGKNHINGMHHRLLIDAYDHNLDFSGRNDTYALDNWVFERVALLLQNKKHEFKDEEQLIFFMHLLGLDSAGHIHKPGSKSFLQNLHSTERRIVDMYNQFEETFSDGKTAYLLTSDHGMTDAGSHGAGAPYETETPFFLWGSGVATKAPKSSKTFQIGIEKILPLYELEQAQLTPLMASLIAIAPPTNNFGMLPIGYLNVSGAYEASASYINALQLLEQFHNLYETHQQGILAPLLNSYNQLNERTIDEYKMKFKEFNKSAAYDSAIELSSHTMKLTLDGIDYYHGYYRNTLLFCTTAIFLGWIYYLLQLLVTRNPYTRYQRTRLTTPILFFIATIVLIYVHLQCVDFATAFYFLLPIFVWMYALQQQYTPIELWRHYGMHKGQLVILVCCAEILVIAFFQRQIISLAFLLNALINNWRAFLVRDHRFYIWTLLVVILIIFPLLPPSVGYKNNILLLIGMLLTLLRAFCNKVQLPLHLILIGTFGLGNALYCIHCHSNRLEISVISLIISWCYLVYTFAALMQNRTTFIKIRLELIVFNLTMIYNFFCTSYESIFIIMLASEMQLSLSAHEIINAISDQPPLSNNSAQQLQSSFRIAFAIIIYTFFSFFGTGNIASVSSFDPNVIRCFLITFQPFAIMFLVILKLIIPIVLNISIIYAISDFTRSNERSIFICLLLVCDIMGLNFLFLVRNKGSWLDIGTSISHFVIMEVTTLVLLCLTLPAKLFLRLHTVAPLSLKIK